MLDNHSTHTANPETELTALLQDVPFATELILVSLQELIQLKADRNRYKDLHQRALLKVNALEDGLALEKGKVRDLNHRLYGKKTEKATSTPDALPSTDDFMGPPRPPVKTGCKKRTC